MSGVSVSVKTDIKPAMKVLGGDKLGLFAAKEFKRLVDDYVPMDIGQLAGSVNLKPWELEYFAPYAAVVYNGGRGGKAKFKKDRHAKASKEWDKAAVRDGKDKDLNSSMQGWIDSNL